MKLLNVYQHNDSLALGMLYQLLIEREPHENISHKEMPTWDKHCAFVRSKPHAFWYWFDAGCIYLTNRREIGIGVLKACRGQGFAKEAIRELMRLHPGPFLANINPHNEASVKLFTGLGFLGPIQHTYERPA